jgi:hypothetical protein
MPTVPVLPGMKAYKSLSLNTTSIGHFMAWKRSSVRSRSGPPNNPLHNHEFMRRCCLPHYCRLVSIGVNFRPRSESSFLSSALLDPLRCRYLPQRSRSSCLYQPPPPQLKSNVRKIDYFIVRIRSWPNRFMLWWFSSPLTGGLAVVYHSKCRIFITLFVVVYPASRAVSEA